MSVTILLPIIIVIILLVFFIVFLAFSKRQENTLETIDKKGKIKEDNKVNNEITKKSTSVDKKTDVKKEDVFRIMEFDRILDDMIVQKGGSRFTMAIQCKGINYDLMSEVEQLSVEEGFITFLNTLKYPIQIYVQAQNIDLKGVIEKYKENVAPMKEKYDSINEQYSKIASAFDADENEFNKISKERDSISNVYEYANDIIRSVEKMNVNKNLLERKFFILLSYNTSEIAAIDKFNKDEIVEMCSTELLTRCRGIISALASCSVSGRILNSNELADLLYSSYNRDDKGILSVKEAIESGFYRLYSTSEDAFTKRAAALDDYLKTEAKYRALKAMKEVIEDNSLETPASQALDEEEEISRRATNLVKAEKYDPELENAINSKIINEYRNVKKEFSELDKIQREEIREKNEEEIKEIESKEKLPKPHGIELIEKSKEYENESHEDLGKKNEEEKNNFKDESSATNEVENSQNLYVDENDNNVEDEENDSIV